MPNSPVTGDIFDFFKSSLTRIGYTAVEQTHYLVFMTHGRTPRIPFRRKKLSPKKEHSYEGDL
jgi:hypothetical protein